MSDTVINDSIKYPYIMKPASQPQFQLYKWDILHKYYISRKKTTIGSIQTVYAPGNTKWAEKVAKSMGEIAKHIMN